MAVPFRWIGLAIAISIALVAAGLAPTLRAQSAPCVQEVEPNDTPATATPVAGPACIEGALSAQDQDAFAWSVDAAGATHPWRIRIEGIDGELTQVDVLRVAFAEGQQ